MKLCINCHWYRALRSMPPSLGTCGHPHYQKPVVISPVDGSEQTDPPPLCGSVRSEHGACGPDATLFEKKDEV